MKVLYTQSGRAVQDFTASNNRIASNFFFSFNTRRCAYSLGNGVTFEGNTYTAQIDCPESEGMFCVPVPWSANWTAAVNGADAPVENINGGLIGIPVKRGASQIVMTYRTPNLDKGLLVSVIGIALFLLVYFFGWRKDSKKTERKSDK